MPFDFSGSKDVSFKESPLTDVAGDYHVTNNTTTDNRKNYDNTTNRNIFKSYSDSTTQDNRKGNLFSKANYGVDSRGAATANFPPRTDAAAGKTLTPQGVVGDKARDSSNTLKQNGRGRVVENRNPQNQAIQEETLQRRLAPPRPSQNHLEGRYLPAGNAEIVTDILNEKTSPAPTGSEDRMAVYEIPQNVVYDEPSPKSDPALEAAIQQAGNTAGVDTPRKKRTSRVKKLFYRG